MNGNQGNKAMLIIAVLVALAAVIFIWYYVQSPDDADLIPGNNDAINGDENTDNNAQAAWDEYVAEDFVDDMTLTFDYPVASIVDMPNTDTVRVRYLGPETIPNSEITDGYIITIRSVSAESIDDYAADTEGLLNDVETITFNGQDARQYQVETQLGTIVTHTVFESGVEGELVDVSVGAYGDRAQLYRNEINDILDSLEVEVDAGGNASVRGVSTVAGKG